MAELYLKTIDSGDPSGFSDGDIIQAFSNRQVLCHNAQMICNPRNFGFNPDGYRDLTTLTYFMFQEFYQHKFIRISKREVKRIDQDGNEEIFSDTTSPVRQLWDHFWQISLKSVMISGKNWSL